MGFGSSFKKFTSNPGRMAAAGLTLGGSEVLRAADKSLGIKDMLLGKKNPGSPGSYTELDPSQKRIIDLYSGELEKAAMQRPIDASQIAGAQIANQERLAKTGVADAERRAQSLIAQRGLGKSAAGISALLGVRSNLGNQLNAIRAQRPGMERDILNQEEANRLNRIGNIAGGINQTLGTRMYNLPIAPTGRQGGLLGLGLGAGGAFLGYKKGGAQGALAGYQVGSGLGQGFSNMG